jgi:hypothetical protein
LPLNNCIYTTLCALPLNTRWKVQWQCCGNLKYQRVINILPLCNSILLCKKRTRPRKVKYSIYVEHVFFLNNIAVLMLYLSKNVMYTQLLLVFGSLEAKCRLPNLPAPCRRVHFEKSMHKTEIELPCSQQHDPFTCPRLDQFSPNIPVFFL